MAKMKLLANPPRRVSPDSVAAVFAAIPIKTQDQDNDQRNSNRTRFSMAYPSRSDFIHQALALLVGEAVYSQRLFLRTGPVYARISARRVSSILPPAPPGFNRCCQARQAATQQEQCRRLGNQDGQYVRSTGSRSTNHEDNLVYLKRT